MNLTRRKLVGWIIGVAVLCLAWFFYSLLGPNPPIIVSRETTYITEPLGDDGLPDYVAYWVQQASDGVTPENNAAVLIWQALWPGDLEQKYWQPFCDALGLPEVPSADESLVPPFSESVRQQVATWLADRYVMPEGMDVEVWKQKLLDDTVDEVIDEAMSHPWTGDQIPPLAQWVAENKEPLDLLVKAAARPRYYSPSPSFLDGSDEILVGMQLVGFQNIRAAARALNLRAMYCLGEGRLTEAWEDLRATHRLARLCAEGQTLVEQLVAIAVDGVACSGTLELLQHLDRDQALADQVLAELTAMEDPCDIARSMDLVERLYYLDAVLRLAAGEVTVSDFSSPPASGDGGTGPLSVCLVDWNVVLKAGNHWYDRFASALKLENRAERTREFDRIEKDLQQLEAMIKSPIASIGGLFSRNQRSALVGDMMQVLFLPAVQAASQVEDRSQTTSALTRTAAALAVYRARHGEYPDELAALVPDVLPELPLDLYSEKPFIYERKSDGGYLLYSVFENGVDDGGTDIGKDQADLVIRVPVPPFKLPEPSVAR